jgi:hypothetical protein
MKKGLPLLSDMIFPSFCTIFRGVKIKEEGINIEKHFDDVTIDNTSLKAYKSFFDWDREIPFSFFYLMAQRAQGALMLDSGFTISIPGLIHVTNKLKQLAPINHKEAFTLKVKVKVDYKATGSLIPQFRVDFVQNAKTVICCESIYIAKRKGKKTKKARGINEDDSFPINSYSENWEIEANLGEKYALASGDKNPIHSSKIFAKIIGFRAPILHGWYSVSRILKKCETEFNTSYEVIDVAFKAPIFLPSKQILEWYVSDEKEVIFQVKNQKTNKLVLNGKLR